MTITKRFRWLSLIGLSGVLVGCSSVHIQTGPQTDAEVTQQSEDTGRSFKTTWADRLQSASPVQQAGMLKLFMDSTTARFLRMGEQVNQSWRDESRRRGSQVPVSEIRTMVERSTQLDLPMLEAYEDVLEYGVGLIHDNRQLDAGAEGKLVKYRDLYLEIYSAVFYPNGTREEFENQLQLLGNRALEASQELETELSRSR